MPGSKYSGGYLYDKTGNTLIYEFDSDTSTVQQVLNSQEAIAANVSEVSNTIGGQSLSGSESLGDYRELISGKTSLYDVTPEPETITGFFLDGQEYVLGGSGGGEWGTITGTLSDQTDLNTALNSKVGSSNNTINNVVHLSQADYDALQNPDNNTWYSTPDNGSGGFDPENAGSVGQVVKKTSTGYGWGNIDSISTTQPANPVAGSTYFDTTSLTIKVYDGTQWKEVGSEGGGSGTPISDPGIYWDKENGLISVSSNGTTWMTIADKNLGATEVFTVNDALNHKFLDPDKQCGLLYQWGRPWPFSYKGIVHTNTLSSNVSNDQGLYIANKGDWLSTTNNDLWGATTNTYTARKGPCLPGWHVPSRADLTQLDTILKAIGRMGIFMTSTSDIEILKFSPAGMWCMDRNDNIPRIGGSKSGWTVGKTWVSIAVNFRLSDYASNANGYIYTTDDDGEGDAPTSYPIYKSTGAPIRPFKNEGVQPTTTWEVLYQPS